jgi:conjugal transfer pilus assembly protein TraI
MGVNTEGSPAGAPISSTEFRYPPVDPGIPALDASELLPTHQELIDRIKLCLGVDRSTFDQTLLPLLRRYAAYVHLLPCTADNYFNEPGGLLRMGLETGFFALQGTDAHIFSGRATITERRRLEPRWRLATFVGGLCCELHRPLSHMIVTDAAGNEWPSYLGALSDWLRAHRIARYFLKWRPNATESRALGLFALPHVVSAETLQDLTVGNAQIVPHLLAAIAGLPVYRDRNVLETLVRRSLALVIDRFLLASAQRYGKPQLGSHLERYLVDALRRLAASNPGWIPNAEKSRVWHGADGMFLAWPASADDIRKLLEADQLPGIPKAPETILEILLTAGVVTSQPAGGATWRIHPPGGKAALEAVKLSAPAILYAESDKAPEALPQSLLRPAPGSSPAADAAAPDATAPGRASSVPPVVPHDSSTKTNIGKRHPPAAPPTQPPSGQPDPEQLTLPILSTVALAPAAQERTEPVAEPALPPQLLAPLRLPAIVRDALAEVVATLAEGEAQWVARPMDGGLFVPLAALAARKAAPPAAIRALGEAGMLASPSPVTQFFKGEQTVGILIDARHVTGLPSPPKEAS